MKSKIYFSLLVSFMFLSLNAQDKVWDKDLKDDLYKVGWILQANEGTIIASGAKGLSALDHKTGETKWMNEDFKGVNKNSYLNIDGLPLFYIEYASLVGRKRGAIVNAANGEVVYDTKDAGYSIRNSTTIPEQGIILFELTKEKSRYLMAFSLENWSEKWITEVGENKGIIGRLEQTSFINHGPYFNKNKDMLIAIKDQVFAIDSKGGVKWQQEMDKRIKAMVYSPINNSLYLGIRKSKKLKVLNPDNGEDITPGKLKLRGTMIDVISDEDDNLILVETEGFNIIDPKTNTFKWKKSFKIDDLAEVISHPKGLIAIGKGADDSAIALVDKNGKKIWYSKVKGYAYYANPTPKGILYVSTERANILDFEKGKDVWKKDVKFRSIPAVTYDESEKKVIIFENKKGYKFDLETGGIELFAEDIKLEKVKKDTPLSAEYIKGAGYLIQTGQHMSLLSPTGDLVYTQHYKPAASLKGFIQLAQVGLAVAGVDIDIQGNLDNINTLTALANGAYINSEDQGDGTTEVDAIAGLYAGSNMTPVFEITKERYSNSKSFNGYKFVVTKLKEEGIHAILMVEKSTGKTVKRIELKDKTPNYFIDEVDNVVFINEKNKIISAIKF